MRWDADVWNELAAQLAHVRAAVLESALIRWPALQLVCAMHVSDRCTDAVWYVSARQAEQLLAAVFESALIRWPLEHVVCAVQLAADDLSLAWYAFAPQATHLQSPSVFLRYVPLPHNLRH